VTRGEPFQLTVEEDSKPLPLTESVNAPLPAVVLAGLSDVIRGA
jgi:hypothetical protein